MSRLYHTDLRPTAANGSPLKPLDLVVIDEVPQHYWIDPAFAELKNYAGCYGLITYSSEGASEPRPYYYGNKQHPGWISGDGGVVNVLSRRIITDENVIATCEFWIPPASLRKIPFNSLIMNVFADYPWQMGEEDGPGSILFVRKGMAEFAHIKRILETPYDILVAAHRAAMAVLDTKSSSTGKC